MPIKLDKLAQAPVAAKAYSAKFFDKKLTGTGAKTGILSSAANPCNTGHKVRTTVDIIDPVKRTFRNGGVTTTYVPLTPMTCDAWAMLKSLPSVPGRPAEFARDPRTPEVSFSVSAEPAALVLQESEHGQGQYKVIERKLTCAYRVIVTRANDTRPDEPFRRVPGVSSLLDGGTFPVYAEDLDANLPKALVKVLDQFAAYGKLKVDRDAVDAYLASYSLYDHVASASEHWQVTLDAEIKNLVSAVRAGTQGQLPDPTLNVLYDVLSRMEFYKVPLPIYLSVYAHMNAVLDPLDVRRLSKSNLNLLLSDTMNGLTACKPQLNRVVPEPGKTPAADPFYSPDQRKAIESDEPLVLIQSGAGSGKSTTIKGRLQYMDDCGIDPRDIMVISFTNAAADHISEIAPHVHSMTIAKMIHSIYELNFPNHSLSSEETLANSLDIYMPNDPFAMNFKRVLMLVAKESDPTAVTKLNTFVENHYDEVMHCLDVTGQTTLNLEIVVCYQKIDQLSEPPEVASRHLIIDEVQDNSIFEFVYALRYVTKHLESLYIVGDASQTLYEFRASNPRALNVMEASGVFATYKLQVNYRSNQDILDFANVTLADIEANRYAQIQLQANSLAPVTAQSFSEHVRLVHFPLSKLGELPDMMTHNFRDIVQPYVEERLALGQKVCFLTFTRRHSEMFRELVASTMPTVKTASLIPKKSYNSTVFSDFIRRYWGEVRFAPQNSVVATISTEIVQRLDTLLGAKRAASASAAVHEIIHEWRTKGGANAKEAIWDKHVSAGLMTRHEMLEKVKESMLEFEIEQNTARQAVLSAKNAAEKESDDVKNADVLFSTIHSAKGLEFDNTVVLYRAENQMDEEDKRMYYVAFTRAMHSELVLSYETLKNPNILVEYRSILEQLVARDQAAMLAGGSDAVS